MSEQNTENNVKAGMQFLNIASSLAGMANRLAEARKNGEPFDVFEAFNEAMDKIKYPADDVINAETVE